MPNNNSALIKQTQYQVKIPLMLQIAKMSNIQRNFQKAFTLYQAKGPILPPKISWKLDLILYMAKGNIPNKQLLTLQQSMEYQDLENLQSQSLKLIFNNIIDTLFNNHTVESKKCQVRKKGIFTNWVDSCIHYDKLNFLLTFSNKTYTYQKGETKINKNKESKRSLDFYYKGTHKYTFKFENQSQMKSIWLLWQKQIIDFKAEKNFQEMQTLLQIRQQQSSMNQISLFNVLQRKRGPAQKNKSFSPQPHTSISQQEQFSIKKQQTQICVKKKGSEDKSSHLKPVPHQFLCRLKSQKSIIALSKEEQARIYVENIFSGKLQQKRLLSFLLLQKAWNSYLVMEFIEKTDVPNQIKIYRRYDTLKDLGQFAQTNLKATYSAWNSNMSMLTIESDNNFDNNQSFHSNCVITLQSDKNKVRILIEDRLTSKVHSNQKLKKILLDMYKEVIKLELVHQTVIFRDFDAETIIVNMLEDEESTNTESQEDIGYFEDKQSSFQKDSMEDFQETVQIIPKNRKQTAKDQIVRLKSPLQFPNPDYIKSMRNRQFQKNYFKYKFPQEILSEYDNYIPFYRIDQLIENKVYQITTNRDLKFIDQQLLDSQKEILRFILRQVGANLISGKSILNVSLPVDIFQGRSALQRYVAQLGCCPDYLLPRAQSPPLEQIKYVTGLIMNVVCCELLMQKPFNPILGQTFQGYIKGIPVYYEEISHHPPMSAYYMKCQQFTLYGNFIPFIDVGLNTGVGGNLGAVNIVFKNGSHFQCYFPPSQISGLLYGDRKFRCYNRGYVFQKNLRLYSQFSIQNQKKGVYQSPVKLKGGQIIGGVYLVKKQFIDQIERYRTQHKNLKKFGGLTKQMIEQKYNSISGEWFGKIMIDSKVINENIFVYPVEYAKNVLPSDSNYRLDVLYHRMKDSTRSQKQKQVLQIIQRNDRKLREKYSKK